MSATRALQWLSLLLAGAMGGCMSPTRATDMWPMLEVASQSQCSWPVRDPTARLFESAVQWRAVAAVAEASPLKRTPDWTRHAVLAFTTGARPTPGFSIELLGDKFALQQDTLRIGFRERTPAPGSLQAQMLTQPCVFVLVERGPWRRAVFRNADTGAEFPTAQESAR